VVAVEAGERYDEIRTKFETERFSRMPVYRDSIDDIIGVLHLQEFAFSRRDDGEFKIENFMREPFLTYESKPLDELFNLMRGKRVSIAIVLDEYGGTAGMITLEDLIEEIVGEIEDEYDDAEEDISKIKDGEYLVDGSTKLDDINEVLGVRLESEDFESIGGYVMGIVGNIPEQNETVTHEDITFTIEEVDKNRILKLRICTNTEDSE
jgi:putative hemolysin